MADVLVNALVDLIANFVLGSGTAPALKLHLFVNNVTITDATVAGDLTECTAAGYAAVLLPNAGWSGSTTAGIADYTHPDVVFNITAGGGQTIFGHYITDNNTGNLLWGQTWGSSFPLPAGASTVTVTPSWSDHEC